MIESIHEIQWLSAAFTSIMISCEFQLLSSFYVSFIILQIMWQKTIFHQNKCYLKLHCWNKALKRQRSIQHQKLLICKFEIRIWINLLFTATTFYLMNMRLVDVQIMNFLLQLLTYYTWNYNFVQVNFWWLRHYMHMTIEFIESLNDNFSDFIAEKQCIF